MWRYFIILLFVLAACTSEQPTPTESVPSETATAEATAEATVEETAEVTAVPTLSDGEIQLTEVLETATEHFSQVATNEQLLLEVGGTGTQHVLNGTATAEYIGTEMSAIETQRAALVSPTPTWIPTWTPPPSTPRPNVVYGLECRNGTLFEVLDEINDELVPYLSFSNDDGTRLVFTETRFANEFGFCSFTQNQTRDGLIFISGYGVKLGTQNETIAGWISAQNLIGDWATLPQAENWGDDKLLLDQ